MFALLCSTDKEKWRIVEFDEDKEVLTTLMAERRAQPEKQWEDATDEEKLLGAIFGISMEYKIVRLEPME